METILSIAGKPGLYKLVSRGNLFTMQKRLQNYDFFLNSPNFSIEM